jgi:hypothetical protein
MSEPAPSSGLTRLLAPATGLRGLSALALSWATASIWFPYGWDHGILAAVGDAITRGDMPYRDAWDMKGPAAFYGYALAQWIFGRNMWGIRLLDLTLLAAASFALAAIVARVASPAAGRWAAVAFVLWFGSLTWFFVSQPDGWVAMLIALAVVPLMRGEGRAGRIALVTSGILVGICALIKPFYALFACVPLAFVLGTERTLTRRAARAAVVGAAVAAPIAATLVWFAMRGALGGLLEVHVSYAAAYADSLRPDLIARRLLNYFWINGVPTPAGAVAVLLPAVAVGGAALWREHRPAGLVVLTWLAVALIAVALQGKFWFYQWTPTFPPFLALGAVGLHRLLHMGGKLGAIVATASAALFVIQIAVVPAIDVARWVIHVSGAESQSEYYAHYRRRNYVATDEVAAARYLRDHTGEGETVAVFGNDATVLYLSGRPSASRFVFAMPLTRDVRGPFRQTYRREYLEVMRRRPPRYVVIGQPHDGSNDKQRDLQAFPELLAVLNEQYRLDERFGFLDLYRRIDQE